MTLFQRTKVLTIGIEDFRHYDLVSKSLLRFIDCIRQVIDMFMKGTLEPRTNFQLSRLASRLSLLQGQVSGIQGNAVYAQLQVQALVQIVGQPISP